MTIYQTNDISLKNCDGAYSGSDAVANLNIEQIFIAKARRMPLLSHREETFLMKRIQRGKSYEQLLSKLKSAGTYVPESDIRSFNRIIELGRISAKKMAESNLRLVIKYANQYKKYMDIMDLYQEGYIGLNSAISNYDYSKGSKFSTYASYWIKQALQRAIDLQGKNINPPVNKCEKIRTMRRIEESLIQDNKCHVTDRIIASKMEIDVSELLELKSLCLPEQSIDSLYEEDEKTSPYNIKDENIESPEESATSSFNRDYLLKVLSNLSDSEKISLIIVIV